MQGRGTMFWGRKAKRFSSEVPISHLVAKVSTQPYSLTSAKSEHVEEREAPKAPEGMYNVKPKMS